MNESFITELENIKIDPLVDSAIHQHHIQTKHKIDFIKIIVRKTDQTTI